MHQQNVKQPLRFLGQIEDRETGFYYNYHRYYNPKIGRYTQPDPIGLAGGINPYVYADNNPIMNEDPSGEFVPQLLGFVIGAGLEYLTNPCATTSDILLSGGLGAIGGGLGKIGLLRYGPKSLTRVHGKEWSHAISKKMVNKYTSGSLNKLLNKRGGLNGSWVSPKRHYKHDAYRHPRGWRQFGIKYKAPLKALDRIPDWAKASTASGVVGSTVTGMQNDCECQQ